MQICWHDGFSLDVDEVLAAVGFNSQGEESVWIDVPEQFPEEARAAIARAPGCVAGALDFGFVWGEFC